MKHSRAVIIALLAIFAHLLLFRALGAPIADEYFLLRAAFIVGASVSLGYALQYAVQGRGLRSSLVRASDYFGLPLLMPTLIVACYLPLLTSKFFYHDDFLNYTGFYQNFFPMGIKTGRIGAHLYIDLLHKMTVETSFFGRAIAVVGVLGFFFLFKAWMSDIGYGSAVSQVVPYLCAICLPFLNISAYVTECTFIWAGLFSCISVVFFFKALRRLPERLALTDSIIFLLVSFLSLLLSLFTYQATSTVGFAFLVAYLLSRCDSRRRIVELTTKYYLFFGFTAVVYLYLNKLIWRAFQTPVSPRATLIESLPEAVEKGRWFITEVLPQSVMQMLFVFGTSFLYHDESSIAGVGFRDSSVGNIVMFSVFILALVGCVMLLCRSGSFGETLRFGFPSLILLGLSLPYSYFFFLVVRERSYLSFYVAGVVMVLLVALSLFVQQIMHLLISNRRLVRRLFLYAMIPALIFVSFNGSRYLSAMWVRKNDFPYQFLKRVLANSGNDSGRIHIIGSSGQVDIYWINAAKIALHELGRPRDSYAISYSDSEDLVNAIEAQRYDAITRCLSAEEAKSLSAFYSYNISFGYYFLAPGHLPSEARATLRSLLEKADILPTEEDHALLVDMRRVR